MKGRIFKLGLPLLLLLCARANAQSTVSRVIHVTGAAFDLSTTIAANGYTPEKNPIMGQHPPQQVIAMGSLAFAFDHVTQGLKVEHPRFATTLNIMAGVMHFAAGGWNIHVIHATR